MRSTRPASGHTRVQEDSSATSRLRSRRPTLPEVRTTVDLLRRRLLLDGRHALLILAVGRTYDIGFGNSDNWSGTWSVASGTDAYAGMRGRGTWVGAEPPQALAPKSICRLGHASLLSAPLGEALSCTAWVAVVSLVDSERPDWDEGCSCLSTFQAISPPHPADMLAEQHRAELLEPRVSRMGAKPCAAQAGAGSPSDALLGRCLRAAKLARYREVPP